MKIDVDGIHNIDNKDVGRYALKKIGSLEKYIPRHARKSAHAEIKLKEVMIKDKKECMCEVVMHLPRENFAAKESTMNMFAAIDIVEEKVKSQLRKYKDKHKVARKNPIKRILHRFRPSDD